MVAASKPAARSAKPAAAAAFEQVTAYSNETLQSNIGRSMAAVTEMGSFGKENMEAFVSSATVAQKGFEALTARYVAFTKSALENHMAATRAIMTSKSVQEMVERQSDYAKSSYETYLAEMNALSSMVSGLTQDAMKPLNERMTAMTAMMQGNMAR